MIDESMIPEGFVFSFKKTYKNIEFNIYRGKEDNGVDPRFSFAVDDLGWPITGYLEYGIVEGAIIQMWFNKGYCFRTEVED
jgi:hypothetical protein